MKGPDRRLYEANRLRVKFPEKVAFLCEPHHYKVLYGSRGGIKPWSIARHLLIAGAERSLRIPCARETMQSIREGVHQLLEDQI
jgi:phage terminase large subunit